MNTEVVAVRGTVLVGAVHASQPPPPPTITAATTIETTSLIILIIFSLSLNGSTVVGVGVEKKDRRTHHVEASCDVVPVSFGTTFKIPVDSLSRGTSIF